MREKNSTFKSRENIVNFFYDFRLMNNLEKNWRAFWIVWFGIWKKKTTGFKMIFCWDSNPESFNLLIDFPLNNQLSKRQRYPPSLFTPPKPFQKNKISISPVLLNANDFQTKLLIIKLFHLEYSIVCFIAGSFPDRWDEILLPGKKSTHFKNQKKNTCPTLKFPNIHWQSDNLIQLCKLFT
jgi:hypothetical protein